MDEQTCIDRLNWTDLYKRQHLSRPRIFFVKDNATGDIPSLTFTSLYQPLHTLLHFEQVTSSASGISLSGCNLEAPCLCIVTSHDPETYSVTIVYTSVLRFPF